MLPLCVHFQGDKEKVFPERMCFGGGAIFHLFFTLFNALIKKLNEIKFQSSTSSSGKVLLLNKHHQQFAVLREINLMQQNSSHVHVMRIILCCQFHQQFRKIFHVIRMNVSATTEQFQNNLIL